MGFMIKKWFFDYWDNFLHFLIINVVFSFSLLITLGLPTLLPQGSSILALIIMIGGFLWLGVLTAASTLYINEIAQFRTPEAKLFFTFLKEGLPYGLLYSGLWTLVAILIYVLIPFYSSLQNFVGILASAFLLWTMAIFVLALQYFFPILAQLDKRPRKILRKMFILLFDNLRFSLFLFICSIIVSALSLLTALLLFGPGAIILLGQVGFKLRLYKYDYLEANPKQRKIPWQTLIHEDRQQIGSRSLRNFIFPWRD